MNLAERFWAKVERGDPGECWPWTGARVRGYGRMRVGSLTDGSRRLESAHRIAYRLALGPIPEGLLVCHTCDNPPCCNPAHLFVGTHADNTADMEAKGRGRRPVFSRATHPNSKLTDEQVAAIRSRYRGVYGEQSALAREYGVAPATVRQLVIAQGS